MAEMKKRSDEDKQREMAFFVSYYFLCHSVISHQRYGIFVGFYLYPFPKQQILDASKLKQFADDNFKVEENGRKFSKWVENTVGKGEIARYNFSLGVFKTLF